MLDIDDALRAFLEGDVVLVVGTRDADLTPEIARAWGARVLPDGRTVELCVGLPSGRRTLSNVADNGRIAATFVGPLEYRGVQFKGRVVQTLDATPEDRERVERHRQGFLRQVAKVGIPPALCPRLWSDDDGLAKLRFTAEEAYDQTPGPDAGRSL